MNKKPTLTIYPREKWNARLVNLKVMKRHEIGRITIHHSGIIYDGTPAPEKRIKKLQEFSLNEKNWPDVPYHYKIDLEGGVWECRDIRYAGETNTTYDPTGHALICVMGNFEEQIPTPEQIDSLVKLSARLCRKYEINPGLIKGHLDFADTLCPGKNLYPMIKSGELCRLIEEILNESS